MPPVESSIKLPDVVSISLSAETPILTFFISAAPSPSIRLANVVTPATLKLSRLVCPSTSISAFMSTLLEKVVTPDILTLSKFE